MRRLQILLAIFGGLVTVLVFLLYPLVSAETLSRIVDPSSLSKLWFSVAIGYGLFTIFHCLDWRSRAKEAEKKRGWIFNFRWSYAFYLMILSLLGMLLLLSEFHQAFMEFRNEKIDRFPWTLVVPLAGAPVALFLWYIRDQVKEIEREQKAKDQYQKEKDQKQRDLERLQTDFHKYSEWAASSKDPALRIAAINNLKSFITGEVFGSPRANDFQVPGLSLLTMLLNLASEEVIEEKREIIDENHIQGFNTQNQADGSSRHFFYQVDRIFKIVLSEEYGEALATVRRGSSFSILAADGRTSLTSTYLIEANLRGAYLGGAKLVATNLKKADLQGAYLGGILHWDTIESIEGANITAVRNAPEGFVEWALECGAVIEKDRFRGANLKGADLEAVYFLGADLQFANLQWAFLCRANLQEADLGRANLQNAYLKGIKKWRGIKSIEGANITAVRYAPNGFVEWALERGAVIEKDAFRGADLRTVHLQGADLRSLNLEGVRNWKVNRSMEGANITGVKKAPDGFVEWALERGAVIDEEGDKP